MEKSIQFGSEGIQRESRVSRFVSREGKTTHVEWKISTGGNDIFLVGRDISERIGYEQNLERTVKEKELLLREVHHRVKNNLQIVSSMLNLQQDEYEDPQLNSILGRAQNRIRSMALVHESLYRSENIVGLPFKTYAETLLSAFSMTEQGRGVEIVVNADPLVFSLDLAINCGLRWNCGR
jgi:two-component sensor histidine kinase